MSAIVTGGASLLRWLYTVWVFVAMLFGANLYFGDMANLDSPAGSPEIPVAKDILYLLIVATCFYVGRRVAFDKMILIGAVLIGAICFFGLLKVYAIFGEVDVSYLRVFKNLLLYVAVAFLLSNIILGAGLVDDFVRKAHSAVLFSLLISILLFFFHPVQSYTGRLFGTYGNPNTAGFAAVCCVGLYCAIDAASRTRWRLLCTLIFSASVLIFSASLSAFMALISFIPLMLLFTPYQGSAPAFKKLLISVAFLSVVAGLAVALIETPTLIQVTALEGRITSLVSEGEEHESVATRMDDFMQMVEGDCKSERSIPLFGCVPETFVRMDSTITSFGYHFGLLGLVVLTGIVAVPYLRFLSIPRILLRSPGARRLPPLMALLTTIVVFNFPIQHTFEIFPVNFLFAIIIAMLLFELNPQRLYRRLSTNNSQAV